MKIDTFPKQIMFSTVRVIAQDGASVGTAFLVRKKISEEQQQIFLVTNKHVIAQADAAGKIIGSYSKGQLTFIKQKDGEPSFGDSFTLTIDPNFSGSFLQHPEENVDLAICNISDIYNKITQELKQNIYIKAIPLELIPSAEVSFDAIEDVLFVGYPNGMRDEKNHTPIIRKGMTATPFEIDYEGQKKFLIDAQVFPGSSGSPVFIKENNFKQGSLTLGERWHFVGVISKVFCRNEQGQIIETVAPTNTALSVVSRQMIGLGLCEKSSQINEMIDMLK